jgi:hypothetical protein
MATKKYIIRAKVVDVWYKTTTNLGNNVYWVKLETEKGSILQGYTRPNSAICFYISNSPYKELSDISYHYTKSGVMVLDSAKSLNPERL